MIAGEAVGAGAVAGAGPLPSVPAGLMQAAGSGAAALVERHPAERIASEARAAEAPRP